MIRRSRRRPLADSIATMKLRSTAGADWFWDWFWFWLGEVLLGVLLGVLSGRLLPVDVCEKMSFSLNVSAGLAFGDRTYSLR